MPWVMPIGLLWLVVGGLLLRGFPGRGKVSPRQAQASMLAVCPSLIPRGCSTT